ncbi:MAG: hypothetical protein FWF97_00285 [Alphaproteobacteria bacterium]|nr:hypothetical protein [Alphaproteobacteria bacterium]
MAETKKKLGPKLLYTVRLKIAGLFNKRKPDRHFGKNFINTVQQVVEKNSAEHPR